MGQADCRGPGVPAFCKPSGELLDVEHAQPAPSHVLYWVVAFAFPSLSLLLQVLHRDLKLENILLKSELSSWLTVPELKLQDLSLFWCNARETHHTLSHLWRRTKSHIASDNARLCLLLLV